MVATLAELAALGLTTAGLYGANALAGGEGERLDRTLVNTAGNLGGAYAGYKLAGGGIPGIIGGAIGTLGGGYISDRVADIFDSTGGRVSPTELLNAHLENDPIAQQAMYQEKIRQARLMEKEMQRQRMLQYQAQMAQQQGA